MMKKQAVLIFVLGSFSTLLADTPAFQGLGQLWEYGTNSGAYAVSADGSTIVGASGDEVGNSRAVMWKNHNMQVLGDSQSKAFNVTSDGSIAVGDYAEASAVYWENGTMTVLSNMGPGNCAKGVSADGSVIVGEGNQLPLAWKNGTLSVLDDLPGGLTSGTAFAVSADGTIAVGTSYSSNGNEAVYWNTQDGGVHSLGYLSESHYGQRASNISPDGSMIVGWESGHVYEGVYGYQEAFLWEDGEMVDLGRLDVYSNNSHAFAVSNTEIVVGMAEIDNHEHAFIWDEFLGMRELKQVLTGDYGLDLTGWQLQEAYDISADGNVIVGAGINPDGYREAWVATIPEPCTILLLGMGGLLINRKKKFYRRITNDSLSL